MVFPGGFPVVVNYSAAAKAGSGDIPMAPNLLQMNGQPLLQMNGQDLLQMEV